MLKVYCQEREKFDNTKCGEVFFKNADIFEVSCSLCCIEINFEEFISHFRSIHLPLANESSLHTTIQDEDPIDVAVKQEQELDSSGKPIIICDESEALQCHTEDDDDEICLLDLFRRANLKRKKETAGTKSIADSTVSPAKQSSQKYKKNKLAKPEKIELLLSPAAHDSEAYDVQPGNTAEIGCGKNQDIEELEDFTDNQLADSVPNDEVNSVEELPYQCQLCKRHYPTNKSLVRHKWRLHNPNRPPVRKQKVNKISEQLVLPPAAHDGEAYNVAPDNTVEKDLGKSKDTAELQDFTDNQLADNTRNDEVNSVEELPYQCQLCKRHYPSNKSLLRHQYRLHNPYKPTVRKRMAPKILNQKKDTAELEDLSDNQLDDKVSNDEVNTAEELPYQCLVCQRYYPTNKSLIRHKWNLHNPNRPPVKKRTAPKISKHKCSECGKEFRSARDLRGHNWEHTGIICDVCGKTFSQVGNMMRHRIRHTGKKDFKCKECDKEFFTLKELKSHVICHTGLMPWICDICGKPCRDRGVLSAHMRRHTGERPAKCDVCGKCFYSFHDLNVHLVTHTSERPFECDICASAFRSKKALRVHKLTHATDRKHVCKICDKSFLRQHSLNTHLRTHNAMLLKPLESPQMEPEPGLLSDKLITNTNVT